MGARMRCVVELSDEIDVRSGEVRTSARPAYHYCVRLPTSNGDVVQYAKQKRARLPSLL